MNIMQANNSTLTNVETHYSDVKTTPMAPQVTSVTSVNSTACSGDDQIKHQSFKSLAFVRGIRRGIPRGIPRSKDQ